MTTQLPGGSDPSRLDTLLMNSTTRVRELAARAVVGPRHRKGGKLRYKNSEILGRVLWDSTHASPWVVFKNITEFRTWTTAIRAARPGCKTEWMYFGSHTPKTLLASALERA